MSKRKGDWVQTYTGKAFYPWDVRFEDIDIVDIAHSLSMQCRFNGHCEIFYSIAEHSVHTSYICDEEDELEALLHDAPEYVIGDMASPIKRNFPDYKLLDDCITERIFTKYGAKFPLPESVKRADIQMLSDEAAVMLGPSPQEWFPMPDPIGINFQYWTPKEAKGQFLNRFNELMDKRK